MENPGDRQTKALSGRPCSTTGPRSVLRLCPRALMEDSTPPHGQHEHAENRKCRVKPNAAVPFFPRMDAITVSQDTTQEAATPLGMPRSLFWDVNPAKVDVVKHANWIITRVVERGRLEDWHTVRRHYGDEAMISAVTSARDLSPHSVALCCAAFDLKKEDFRCCTARPFPPAPWIY